MILPSGRYAQVIEVFRYQRVIEVLVRPEDDEIAFRIRACHLSAA